jgi:hypothetical protein
VVLSIYQDLTRIIQRPRGCAAVFWVASTIILLFQKRKCCDQKCRSLVVSTMYTPPHIYSGQGNYCTIYKTISGICWIIFRKPDRVFIVELMKLCVNTGFQKCALIYYGFNWFKNPGEIYFTRLTYWSKASYMVPDKEM